MTLQYLNKDGSAINIIFPKIHIDYSISDFSHNIATLISNAHIQAEMSSAHANLTGSPHKTSSKVAIVLPAITFPLPAIDVTYSQLTITHPAGHIAAGPGQLVLSALHPEHENPVLSIHFEGDRLALTAKNHTKNIKKIRTSGIYRPNSLEISTLSVDSNELLTNFLLQSKNGSSSLHALLSLWGGNISLKATLNNAFEAHFTTSKINIDEITLSVTVEGLPKAGTLVCSGQLEFPVANPSSLSGDISLSIENAEIISIPTKSLHLQASADNGMLTIADLTVVTKQNTLHLDSIVLPLDAAFHRDWPQIARNASGQFQFSLTNFKELSASIPSDVKSFIDKYGIHSFAGQGKYTQGATAITELSIETREDSIKAHTIQSDLTPWITLKGWKEIPINADVQINTKNGAFLKEFISADYEINGAIAADINLRGTLGSPSIAINTSGTGVTLFNHYSFEKINVKGSYQNQTLTLDSLQVKNAQDIIEGTLSYQFSLPHSLVTILDFQIADVGTYLPKNIRQQHPLSGDISGQVRAYPEGKNLSTAFSLHSKALQYSDKNFEQTRIEATYNTDLFIKSLQTTWPEQETSINTRFTVSFKALWDQFTLKISDFRATRKHHTYTLKQPTELVYESGQTSTKEPLIIQDESSVFSLEGMIAEKSIDLDITGEINNGKQFMKYFNSAPFFFQTTSFKAKLKESLKNPQIRFSGSMQQIIAGDAPPLNVVLAMDFQDKQLDIHTFTISDDVSPRLSLQGQVPLYFNDQQLKLGNGQLKLASHFNLQSSPLLPWIFQNKLKNLGAVKGAIDLQGTWQEPIGQFQFSADDILFKNTPQWLPSMPMNLSFNLSAEKDKIILNTGNINSQLLTMQLHGSASLNDLLNAQDAFINKQKFTDAEIDLQGKSELKDIGWLAQQSAIRKISGNISTEFQVSGTIKEPNISASLSLQEGQMRLNNDLPPLQDVQLRADLHERTATITHFSGNLGGAPIKGQGKISLPDQNGAILLDIDVSGKDLLYYRADGIKFRGDTSLRVHGFSNQPNIDGEIILTDTKVSRNIDFLSSLLSGLSAKEGPSPHFPSFTDPPLRDAHFKIKITANKPVIFANNIFKGKITPDLKLHGTGEVPFLSGTMYINDASIILPASKIKISSGLINFLKTNPDRPILEFNGEAKLFGYAISIGISGPYDAPSILLSSTPPLSNEELLLLILAGKRPASESNQQNQGKNYSNVMMYFGKNLVKKLWSNGEEDSDDTLLDRLQLAIGRNITQQGEETIEAQFTLAENIKNSRNALLLTGERDTWDKYNGGIRLVFKFN